jgi:hypothetical protein
MAAYGAIEVTNAANAGADYGAASAIAAQDTAGIRLAADNDATNVPLASGDSGSHVHLFQRIRHERHTTRAFVFGWRRRGDHSHGSYVGDVFSSGSLAGASFHVYAEGAGR